MPNITEELVRREYSLEDILDILGRNHLRLIKEVCG
ncbi:MAG: membrane dipeptidase [Candidatus Bathyarchaeota archaeon]|nr:membrane dipeptidase [Candidatus Bathyarchaeota archaeon]